MLLSGLKLTALGMGVVFVFLLILIYLVHLMGQVLQHYSAAEELAHLENNNGGNGENSPGQGAVVAAITAAIARHRQKN